MRRTINSAGKAIVKLAEGLRLVAYLCPANVWTIGFGSTEGVRKGMKITKEEAEVLLDKDLETFERAVEKLVPTSTTANEFSAMVSLAYNIGVANFKGSSVLRGHLAGNKKGAAASFTLWNKARVKGVLTVLPGLVKRRAEEAKLYLTP
ncbi:lysozyme [Novosphingobium resinovorum]|uniref:lysozyme n=1 Tax=Novosphingobium TaxID=165696 RepID=UPI001B3C9C6D|nr:MULTISPECIES: lysozyme [Novosphingobium]MBF7012549.1 lysozyme [Novosphingobium sp. HR1a]WJM27282.1 lysozyme [Novosphingobium resinovorum]